MDEKRMVTAIEYYMTERFKVSPSQFIAYSELEVEEIVREIEQSGGTVLDIVEDFPL